MFQPGEVPRVNGDAGATRERHVQRIGTPLHLHVDVLLMIYAGGGFARRRGSAWLVRDSGALVVMNNLSGRLHCSASFASIRSCAFQLYWFGGFYM